MKKLKSRWSSLLGGKHQQINLTKGKEAFKMYLVKELNNMSIIATPQGGLI